MPNIDVDMPDAYGVRPIHFAVRKKYLQHLQVKLYFFIYSSFAQSDLKLVEALLNIGKADPTVASVTGKTPLHDACEEPNELVVHVLLNSTNGRIDLNAKTDDGFTPLHVAIDRLDKKRSPKHARSVLETVKLLCKKGADPNVRDKGLRTPLMMIDLTSTLTEGTLENSVARLLVSLNADISILHRVVFNRDLPQDLRDKIKDVVEYLQRKKLSNKKWQSIFHLTVPCCLKPINVTMCLPTRQRRPDGARSARTARPFSSTRTTSAACHPWPSWFPQTLVCSSLPA